MDLELKLNALARLAQSDTEQATIALQKEFEKTETVLNSETNYESLDQHLDILDAISHRFPKPAVDLLAGFIATIESRELSYSHEGGLFTDSIRDYYNASSLIARAIECLTHLGYLETLSVLRTLMQLTLHRAADVQNKAIDALRTLSAYHIDVFFGPHNQGGIGALPQLRIIEELESLSSPDLHKYFRAALTLIDGILSPTMQRTSWSYKTVTWTQGPTPAAPTVADVRLRSIVLLERMYQSTVTVGEKLDVVIQLNDATRPHTAGRNNEESIRMIARDTLAVIQIFATLIRTDDLPVIQKIEHLTYWIFFHALSLEVRAAALGVEQAIAANAEYQIYKTLIGFEGIFSDWETLKKDEKYWEKTDAFRREKALAFAAGITQNNYDEWSRRILRYAETQSEDLATFPVFYYFLESFALATPALAFQFVSRNAERIERFLIPLLRGLWAGPQHAATKQLLSSWIRDGRYLQSCARQFLGAKDVDRELLSMLLQRATEIGDFGTLTTLISVSVSDYSEERAFLIDDLFLPALKVLTEHSNVSWIFDAWFRRETQKVINGLPESGIDLILQNLLNLNEIDYHAEEILYLIAQRAPGKVLQFLCQRLTRERDDSARTFDAIPFQMHKLNEPLSKNPAEAVRMVREQYKGDFGMFIFRGARLLKTIFPDFAPAFESELRALVREGGEANIEFVLAILRNYEGQTFIHEVCKDIVRTIPADSSLRTEVAIALENTGVVTGEFGFAEAYERKKSEVVGWMNDSDEKVRDFAKAYIANLEQMAVADRKRAEEEIALRKHQYGE